MFKSSWFYGVVWHSVSFLDLHRMDTLVTIRKSVDVIIVHMFDDHRFCACVMRTSGIPQLRVIRMERLYGYKWHVIYDRCVCHCFTDDRIWASLAECVCHDVTPQLWRRLEGKRSIQGIAVTSRWRNATAVAWRHTTAEVKCKEKEWWN